jgi:hypothetical protein
MTDEFAARLAASRAAARAALAAADTLRATLDERPLDIPRGFARTLAAVLDEERRAGSARAAALERHYLEVMPRQRTRQLDTSAPPFARLFDTRIDWPRWPRLAAAVARLGRGELLTRDLTIGALYAGCCYGAFMPMLYASADDLATYDFAALDRHLAAPLVHELAHGDRAHEMVTPYIDECIAGWLGTRALERDNDLFAAPWLSQVGGALARVVGAERLRAAHAGTLAWDDALPRGLAAALRDRAWRDYLAERPLHLLSPATRPDPWMKLCFLAAAGAPLDADRDWRDIPIPAESDADRELLDDALAAMCWRSRLTGRSFRFERCPPAGPIDVDLSACRITTARSSELDPAPPAHLFPPSTAARLRARGIAGYTVELSSPSSLSSLPPLARALLDGAPSFAGDGFVLTRR